jgi:hypothetical protein
MTPIGPGLRGISNIPTLAPHLIIKRDSKMRR